MTPNLREEFDVEFLKFAYPDGYLNVSHVGSALWAAQWALERSAKEAEAKDGGCSQEAGKLLPRELRRMAKALGGGK